MEIHDRKSTLKKLTSPIGKSIPLDTVSSSDPNRLGLAQKGEPDKVKQITPSVNPRTLAMAKKLSQLLDTKQIKAFERHISQLSFDEFQKTVSLMSVPLVENYMVIRNLEKTSNPHLDQAMLYLNQFETNKENIYKKIDVRTPENTTQATLTDLLSLYDRVVNIPINRRGIERFISNIENRVPLVSTPKANTEALENYYTELEKTILGYISFLKEKDQQGELKDYAPYLDKLGEASSFCGSRLASEAIQIFNCAYTGQSKNIPDLMLEKLQGIRFRLFEETVAKLLSPNGSNLSVHTYQSYLKLVDENGLGIQGSEGVQYMDVYALSLTKKQENLFINTFQSNYTLKKIVEELFEYSNTLRHNEKNRELLVDFFKETTIITAKDIVNTKLEKEKEYQEAGISECFYKSQLTLKALEETLKVEYLQNKIFDMNKESKEWDVGKIGAYGLVVMIKQLGLITKEPANLPEPDQMTNDQLFKRAISLNCFNYMQHQAETNFKSFSGQINKLTEGEIIALAKKTMDQGYTDLATDICKIKAGRNSASLLNLSIHIGNTKLVDELLNPAYLKQLYSFQKNSLLNFKDKDGYTQLLRATQLEDQEKAEAITMKLLQAGANISTGYCNAMSLFVQKGLLKPIQFMLDRNLDLVNLKNKQGHTLLYIAFHNKNEAVAKFMIEAGADVTAKLSLNGSSAIHLLAQKGNLNAIKLLLADHPHLVNLQNNEGKRPLYYAFQSNNNNNNKAIVNLLIEVGDVTAEISPDGSSAIHHLADKGYLDTMETLLADHPHLANLKNKLGRTPLFYAFQSNNEAMVKLLIEGGADVTAKLTSNGSSAIHHLAKKGYLYTMKALLADHPNLAKLKNNDGETPLYYAFQSDNEAMVKLLIEGGADVTAKLTSNGSSAIHHLAQKGYLDTMKLLLADHPHLANLKNKVGKTPLYYAFQSNNEAVVNLLIDTGAEM